MLLTHYWNSRLCQSQQYRDATVRIPFAAPEFLDGEFEFVESFQVYSVGFILKAVITGNLPDEEEAPGISTQSLIKDAHVLKSFATLAVLHDLEPRRTSEAQGFTVGSLGFGTRLCRKDGFCR
jgi:hypothetical protein